MATLTNTKIKDTYDGLLKTTDNDVIGITEKVITDGLGNASILSIGTQSASFSEDIQINGQTFGVGAGSVASNIAIGNLPLSSNTTGTWNIALGENALSANTTGTSNIALGTSSLASITSGSSNVAIGTAPLQYIIGNQNVSVGFRAGSNLFGGANKTAGSYNTYLGSLTYSGAANTDNEIVIGYGAVGNGSNTATYGNSSITDHYFDGNVRADFFYGDGSNLTNLPVGTIPTLQQVTTSGATTTDSITVGGLTAASLIYPSTDGTSGQVISTDGAGNLTFTTVSTSTPSLDQVTAVGATSSVNVTINGADLGTIVNSSNTFFGDGALASFTTGTLNTVIGHQALTAATSGSGNTVIGARALDNYTSGTTNTAIGSEALGNGTTLSYNVAVGSDALFYINGSDNVALGHKAGERRLGGGTKSAGDNNIYIGSNTVSSAADTDNEIVIGANAVGNGSNSATYGDSNITSHHFTAGSVNIAGGVLELASQAEIIGSTDNLKISADPDNVSGSSTIEFLVDGSEKMRIDNSGRVGIGTSSPDNITSSGTILSISTAGGLTTNDLAGSLTFITNDGSYTGTYADGVTAEISSISESATGAAYGLAFSTGTTTGTNRGERMRIDSSGNIGINEQNPNISGFSRAITLGGADSGYEIANSGVITAIFSGNSQGASISGVGSSGIRFRTSASGATTERMRIDSSGVVQVINQTPTIQLYNTDTSLSANQVIGDIDFYQSDPSGGGVGVVSKIRSINSSSFQGEAGLAFHTGTTSGLTERMRIDASGNIGIGSSNPTLSVGSGLVIDNTISVVSLQNGTGSAEGFDFIKAGNDGYLALRDGGNMRFDVNGSERMRITSGGDVCIGTTSATGILNLENDAPVIYTNATNGVSGLRLNIGGGSTNLFRMQSAGTNVFLVYSNGNYDFTGSDVSDIAFKENITEITSGLSIIDALVPKTYNMIGREHIRKGGFIAQEVEQVLPEAVHGEDGQKGLDYNSILAHSVKAIQELKAEIEILKSQLNA